MERTRTAFVAFVAVLLTAGYLASQLSFFNGSATEWAMKTDSPTFHGLALALLLGSVVIGFASRNEVNER